MEDMKNMSVATKAIHGGVSKEKGYGSLSMPIYQTSTFVFETVSTLLDKLTNGNTSIRIAAKKIATTVINVSFISFFSF